MTRTPRGDDLATAIDVLLDLRTDVLHKLGREHGEFLLNVPANGAPLRLFVDHVQVWAGDPDEDRDTTITRMLEWATS